MLRVTTLALLAMAAFGPAFGQVASSAAPCQWGHINFEFNSSTPVDELNELGILAQFLRTHPEVRVLLTGHTDSLGSQEFNLRLGLERAEAVKRILVSGGVPPERIEVRSAGKSGGFPGQAGTYRRTDEARWQSRRVEVRVFSPNGEEIDLCRATIDSFNSPRAEAEKAKAEAEKLRAEAEAEKAKAEAEKLRAEAERLRAEAEKIKAEAQASVVVNFKTAEANSSLVEAQAARLRAEAKLLEAQAAAESALLPERAKMMQAQASMVNRVEKYPKVSAVSGLLRSILGFGAVGNVFLRPPEYNSSMSVSSSANPTLQNTSQGGSASSVANPTLQNTSQGGSASSVANPTLQNTSQGGSASSVANPTLQNTSQGGSASSVANPTLQNTSQGGSASATGGQGGIGLGGNAQSNSQATGGQGGIGLGGNAQSGSFSSSTSSSSSSSSSSATGGEVTNNNPPGPVYNGPVVQTGPGNDQVVIGSRNVTVGQNTTTVNGSNNATSSGNGGVVNDNDGNRVNVRP